MPEALKQNCFSFLQVRATCKSLHERGQAGDDTVLWGARGDVPAGARRYGIIITDLDALSDALSGLVDTAMLQSLKPFSEFIGIVFSPLKTSDGELRADPDSGEILG
jgi:hypothetical protein